MNPAYSIWTLVVYAFLSCWTCLSYCDVFLFLSVRFSIRYVDNHTYAIPFFTAWLQQFKFHWFIENINEGFFLRQSIFHGENPWKWDVSFVNWWHLFVYKFKYRFQLKFVLFLKPPCMFSWYMRVSCMIFICFVVKFNRSYLIFMSYHCKPNNHSEKIKMMGPGYFICSLCFAHRPCICGLFLLTRQVYWYFSSNPFI